MKAYNPGAFRPITVAPRPAVTKLIKALYEAWGEAVLSRLGCGIIERIKDDEAARLGANYMLCTDDVFLLHPCVFYTKIPTLALPDGKLDTKHKHALFLCNYSYNEKGRLTKFFFFTEYTQYYEAFMRLEKVFHAITGQRAGQKAGYRLLPLDILDAVFYVFEGLKMDVVEPFRLLEYTFITIKNGSPKSIIEFYEKG